MACDPITELQRCLALVRPVGMSDEAAEQWLMAAVAEVIHITPPVLSRACSDVRKTATHHGQIVPAILASDAVKSHEAHQRTLRRLAADGHHVPGIAALPSRGGVKQIGQSLSRDA